MTQVAKIDVAQIAEVTYLPQALIQEAEKLLIEIRRLDRTSLSLDMLSIYHQELDWLIKNFPQSFNARHVMSELLPRRLAFACRIEYLQTIAP
jgi:hypothetical protein